MARMFCTVRSRMVSVVKPRKSNLTKPIASTSSLSNCDITPPSTPCVYSGQKSVSLPGAINTPPACIPTLRAIPSTCCASSSNCRTSSSFSWRSLRRGSSFSASAIVTSLPGLKGINFEMPSQKL